MGKPKVQHKKNTKGKKHPKAQGQQKQHNANKQRQQKKVKQQALEQQHQEALQQQLNQQRPQGKQQHKLYEEHNQEVLEKIRSVVSDENPREKYERLEEVGKGGYGTVYRAREVETQKEVAMKVMQLYMEVPGTGHRIILSYDEEIEIMRLACQENENIIKYIDSFLVGEEVWLITEFVQGVNLFDISPTQNTSTIAALLYETLKALEFIHSRGLVHRDIKGDNILVSRNGEVKLIDFDFCTMVEDEMQEGKGTHLYMAPEQFGSSYTSKVDIWALGLTVIDVVMGDSMGDTMVDRYGRPDIPRKQLGPELSDFVQKCLVVNPNHRPSATKLLNHKLIQKYKLNSKTILANFLKKANLK